MALAGLLALVMLSGAAQADDTARTAQIDALFEAMDITGIIEVMHDEGLTHGSEIAEQLMPDADRNSWAQSVARIHDTTQMQALVEAKMRSVLAQTDLDPLLAFYTSRAGRHIVMVELLARRAFLDSAAEAASIKAARTAQIDPDDQTADLIRRIKGLIDDSDLIELNVTGALNANMMFLRGLVDGGASDLSRDDILRDVWAQEQTTRDDTRDWLMAFLLVAYHTVNDADLDSYAALWRSPEGRDLNRALFTGFNDMYDQLSYLLARAVAEHMTSAPL